MRSAEVIDHLQGVIRQRGVPENIQSDNGPEFIAHAIQDWLTISGVNTLYISAGSPRENGFVESFHSRLRDELLDCELFMNLKEARMLSAIWREEYNNGRPHSSLVCKRPSESASQFAMCVCVQDKYKHDASGVPLTGEGSPLRKTPTISWSVSSNGRKQESDRLVKLS